MKTLVEFINEWKEDLGNQVIMIMGTPGCGKTYWMQHNGIKFFKKQGIKLNPKELDIDHTLKIFQIIDFPKFCDRLIKYPSSSVINKNGVDFKELRKAEMTVYGLYFTEGKNQEYIYSKAEELMHLDYYN